MLLIEGFATFSPSGAPLPKPLRRSTKLWRQKNLSADCARGCRNCRGLDWRNAHYDGRVWELHPLVVDPQHQRAGIGRALIADLEEQVRQRGGLTITLGTDDEVGQTSLSGLDLYPDIGHHMQTIRNLHGHPYEFYQKCGFVISGLVPDANGYGKPDIIMAKRVQPR
ncbi:MAG: GNAT family N-acetyltransferase [Caldilineaceae bacterium]